MEALKKSPREIRDQIEKEVERRQCNKLPDHLQLLPPESASEILDHFNCVNRASYIRKRLKVLLATYTASATDEIDKRNMEIEIDQVIELFNKMEVREYYKENSNTFAENEEKDSPPLTAVKVVSDFLRWTEIEKSTGLLDDLYELYATEEDTNWCNRSDMWHLYRDMRKMLLDFQTLKKLKRGNQ